MNREKFERITRSMECLVSAFSAGTLDYVDMLAGTDAMLAGVGLSREDYLALRDESRKGEQSIEEKAAALLVRIKELYEDETQEDWVIGTYVNNGRAQRGVYRYSEALDRDCEDTWWGIGAEDFDEALEMEWPLDIADHWHLRDGSYMKDIVR